MRKQRSPLFRSAMRQVRFFLLLLIAYLLQVCVMPYVNIGGISPNLLLIVIAVSIVSLGRLQGFWAGAIFGIMLEIMLPILPLLNLIFYPATTLFACLFFANKTDRQMELERAQNKAGRNLSPYFRILVCTLILSTVFEIVNIVYVYLGGNQLTLGHVQRALTSILLTSLPAIPLGWLIRRILGIHGTKTRRTAAQPDYL